jgi:fructosamine-3-kinase
VADNWIGALPQANPWHDHWPTFFREARLRPQIERARASGRWRREWEAPAERLLVRLPDLLPRRPHPALLHGDLWSGNVLPTTEGRTALVDPAAYVGDRETDLAMTELFGCFDPAYYDAYRAAWTVDPGYPERREIYHLYHLLNHLNLFGDGYALAVARIVRRFA